MSEQSSSEPTVVVERRSGGGIGLFLLGVAVGAGIALLYAPRSGAETRQDLRRGARRLRRKARGVVDEAREVVEDVRDRAVDLAGTTKAAARDAARDAREALERRLAKHGRGAARDEDAEDAGV